MLYVPILKGKEGEFAALEALSSDVKPEVTPLIEVPGVPFDFASGRSAKSLDEHTRGFPERISRSWGTNEFYLSTPYFGEDELLADGRCAFDFLLSECKRRGLGAIPVISPSSSDASLKTLFRRENLDETVCIRLSTSDFTEDVDTDEVLSDLLQRIGRTSVKGLDLVVDFGDLEFDDSVAAFMARSVLAMPVPLNKDLRTVVFAASSFPKDLSSLGPNSVALLPRREWKLWKAIHSKRSAIPQNLVFGDYAISHPTQRELDPRTMRMSANIRYTAPNDWLIVKGRNVNQYGFEQFFELSKSLIQRPEYCGSNYSWGDRFIFDCAEGIRGPGNATTWRKVGVNHHIAFMARQLANPSGPSAGPVPHS